MSGKEFKKELEKYGLDVNKFLDLRDTWNILSSEEKYRLLLGIKEE